MSLPVEILQESFNKVKPYAGELGDRFYENLFTMYPEAKPLFAHTAMGKQKQMLVGSLVMTIDNLTNPEVLTSELKGLGARHVKYGALPAHYPLVGNALLATLEQYLKADWTPEVKEAWVAAYGAITAIMLDGADYPPEVLNLEGAAG
ncbi:globin [Thalassoporum mexicanum PCC 7367]|uniref:globin family protein n=1 Tax=Thalassoporum mexicanum TaxID=3457544 RepID=UPI00029FA733|nr:globin family protein [Pseudanabaena sp. PCC 7367]AFY70923.1 globin [Pseudanabaena sp. PCC 7367]